MELHVAHLSVWLHTLIMITSKGWLLALSRRYYHVHSGMLFAQSIGIRAGASVAALSSFQQLEGQHLRYHTKLPNHQNFQAIKNTIRKPIRSSALCWLSGSSTNDDSNFLLSHCCNQRKELLHKSLMKQGIDANTLDVAAIESIQNPMAGYDGRYGKSAIRVYRSFVFVTDEIAGKNDHVKLTAMAGRTARQIEFLMKRHLAHESEWIRHNDLSKPGGTHLQTKQKTFPIILILDNVRSALNVGSIFRVADAAGCQAIYTTGITPHPGGNGSDKLRKSALGAEFTVPHQHFITTKQAIEHVLQLNEDASSSNCLLPYEILGMETTSKSIRYTEYAYDRSRGVAIILGNEVTGIDANILSSKEKLLDAIIEIPMYGVKNSLNIATCAPIVVYEIIRKWETTAKK